MVDVTIKVRLDGPYKVSGPAVVRDAAGAVISDGEADDVAVLCRCGRSMTAPICDSSHRRPAGDGTEPA
jgi:CDGSH-type Zn-finger protein